MKEDNQHAFLDVRKREIQGGKDNGFVQMDATQIVQISCMAFVFENPSA